MRGRTASIAAATTLLLIIACFLGIPNASRVGASPISVSGNYPYVKPSPLPWDPPSPKDPSGEDPTSRLIVKAKLKHEDAFWIDELFPTWRKHIIEIPEAFTKLHAGAIKVDKGRVANAYLTWIIENYKDLPETIVFLPPNTPQSISDKVRRFQIPFVQSTGFANLHCPSPTTCANLILPFRSPPNEFRTQEVTMPKAWEGIFGNITVPEQLATPPGAQFAVSKTQVQKRKLEEYLKAWTWLNQTDMDDDTAGLVFEYIWHVIFGRDAVFCPELKMCECDVFGQC
jgi:hypothetical protein